MKGKFGFWVVIHPPPKYIAFAQDTSPRVSAYTWSSGFGTKVSDPTTTPTGISDSVSFSPAGADIAVAHSTSPRVSAYPWSSGFGTKYSDPATSIGSNANGLSFSP